MSSPFDYINSVSHLKKDMMRGTDNDELSEKEYRKPKLVYIGLNEGLSNTVRHRINKFFRAVNGELYVSETHQAGDKIKDILKRLKLTINDTNEVEFFVELCEIPKFIHNISPKAIESFIIRRAMLDGEELLMNLKL